MAINLDDYDPDLVEYIRQEIAKRYEEKFQEELKRWFYGDNEEDEQQLMGDNIPIGAVKTEVKFPDDSTTCDSYLYDINGAHRCTRPRHHSGVHEAPYIGQWSW